MTDIEKVIKMYKDSYDKIRKERNDLEDFISNFLLRIPSINSGDVNIDNGYNVCINEIHKLVSAFYNIEYNDIYEKSGIDMRKLQGITLN